MTALSESLASHLRSPGSRLSLCLIASAASVGALILSRSIRDSLKADRPKTIASPRETVLPWLPEKETKTLPYPPDALPGARDVESPYGSVRVYEWGPEDGQKVLLIHGISTPSIALAGLAHRLVEKGCRVMLFDLFGRGYSSGPDPTTHRYSSALYTSQILLCITSSPLPWSTSGFTLIGYSLGGAIAADFTSYFPSLISNLILIVPGGLIRTKHITWRSKLLYSTSGIIPEWLIKRMVARRLWTGPESARSIEPEGEIATASSEVEEDEGEEKKGGLRSHAVYTSSPLRLLPSNPHSTVSNVVDWQIQHHAGFVPAFISSIRYAPIHNQHHRWRIIRENIERGVGRLREVWLVLGEKDPIIIADELMQDAQGVLGSEIVTVRIVKGAGHEVPIDHSDEVAAIIEEVL